MEKNVSANVVHVVTWNVNDNSKMKDGYSDSAMDKVIVILTIFKKLFFASLGRWVSSILLFCHRNDGKLQPRAKNMEKIVQVKKMLSPQAKHQENIQMLAAVQLRLRNCRK